MANKLAGQKAKFTAALLEYNSTEDPIRKQRTLSKMAEVVIEASQNGFTEAEVTSGREVPVEVRRLIEGGEIVPRALDEDPDQLIRQLQRKVDTSDKSEEGSGEQFVYAYGYRCAPDRLKVGRCDSDVISRIASQINTSTPDIPALLLVIRTQDCRALEMAIHGMLRLRLKNVVGGGDEWFLTTRDELLEVYRTLTRHPSGC